MRPARLHPDAARTPPPHAWPAGVPALRPGRAHEATGPAARAVAAALIGAHQGPALWILPPRAPERPDAYGLSRFFDPGRLILADAVEPIDVFWAMEEALRSGAAAAVVAETRKPATLTQGRRLQLAAEAGGATGLLLSPETSAASGARPKSSAAETRWHATPAPSWTESRLGPAWRWELTKNKHGPLGAWTVRPGPDGLTASASGMRDDATTDSLALAAAARRRARPAA